MRDSSVIVACLIALAARAGAQNLCRFYLADQSDAVQGLTLSLEAQSNHVNATQPWQTGVVHIAKAVITAAGPQQLSLNAQPLGTE